MDFVQSQIQFHQSMVQTHQAQIQFLLQLQAVQSNAAAKNPDAAPTAAKQSNAQQSPNQPDAAENLEEYLQNTLSDEMGEKKNPPEWNDSHVAEMDQDQDMIWDRIRRAHPGQYTDADAASTTVASTTAVNLETTAQKNAAVRQAPDLTKKNDQANKNNLEVKIDNLRDIKSNTDDKPTLITALSKFPQKKQNEILRNMFNRARLNIEKLVALDPTLKETMDAQIKQEADRLLEVYLKSH